MKHFKFIVLFALISACGSQGKLPRASKEIVVDKIWDQAPHSAFTDLIRFNDAWYCTFREAPGHVSGPVGQARVLKSADGKNWVSMASFEMKGLDIRDPKLSVAPGNRLMVLMDVEAYKEGKVASRLPYISFSGDGNNFSQPEKSVVDPSIATWSDWVWRVTWHRGMGYAVVYQPSSLYVLKTKDGSYFEKVSKLEIDGYPNESTIRFDKNDKMYVMIRREKDDQMGMLAKSEAPYAAWTIDRMNYRLGGPNFLFLNDKTLCIGSRLYEMVDSKVKPSTVIFLSDLNGKIYKTIRLPSGGDTSYPGMVIYENQLWFSYYSSHEGKTSIYLAKIPLSQLQGT